MLLAVEVEFETSNADHASNNDGITNMDVEEDSAAGNNITYIIYKI